VEFEGQAMHVEFAEAPTAVEYVPAPHGVHVAEEVAPTTVEYVPVMWHISINRSVHTGSPTLADTDNFPASHRTNQRSLYCGGELVSSAAIRPSHTVAGNNRSCMTAAYIYSGGACSSEIRRERMTVRGKRHTRLMTNLGYVFID
jgi:hypothetical protein